MPSQSLMLVGAFALVLVALTAATVTADVGAESPRALRVAVVGDELSAPEPGVDKWPTLIAGTTSWDISVVAVDRAAYTGPDGLAFDDQLTSAAATDPDVVLVVGGLDDVGRPPDLVRQQAADLFGRASRENPRALVVAVGPLWQSAPAPDAVAVIDTAIRSAADSRNVDMCDGLSDPWFGPTQTASDTVRPNDDGQQLIAVRMLTCLRDIDGAFR